MKNFEDWFKELVELASKKGQGHFINIDDPDSYRDYYEDKDTPEECLESEIEHAE